MPKSREIEGANMVFVSAKAGPPNVGDSPSKFTVQYFDEQGNMTIRSGGTRAWRCNNPGNLQALLPIVFASFPRLNSID